MTNTILTLFLILFSTLSFGQSETREDSDAIAEPQAADSDKQTPIVSRQNAESIYENQRRLLEQQYPKDDILQLSANGEKFIGLWEENKSGSSVGTVLLLHGEGQTANWPHTIDTLRADLTHHGWSTLSISLSDPIIAPHPKRTLIVETPAAEQADSTAAATTENNADTQTDGDQTEIADENKTTSPISAEPKYSPKELEFRMQNRIKSAISHLNDEGQFNIVVASYGVSAQRAAKYIQSLPENTTGNKQGKGAPARGAQQADRTVRALIFVNARNSLNETQTSLVDLLNMGEMPILDLYSDIHFLDQTESKIRLKTARDNGMKQYVQVKFLPPTTHVFEDENRVTRRIRGFLSKHAKGVEIGVK